MNQLLTFRHLGRIGLLKPSPDCYPAHQFDFGWN